MANSFCIYCGQSVTPGNAFCISCGSPQPTDSAPPAADNAAFGLGGTVVVNPADAYAAPAEDPTSNIWGYSVPDLNPTVVEDPDPAPIVAAPVVPEVQVLPEVEPPTITPALLQLEINDDASGQNVFSFELLPEQELLVGRDGRQVGIKSDDPRSSRQHFSICLGEGEYVIRDLGSSNGTFVNGLRVVEPAVLSDGDTIKFGRSVAVFRVIAAPSDWGPGCGHTVVI